MKILGISASPRKGGNTDTILKEIIKGAEECNAETETAFLRNYTINPCVGCEMCRKSLTCSRFNDGMNLLYPKIEEADVIILGSPVYNYNVTSLMKSFIDRLYPYYIFSNDRPRKYSSRLANKDRKSVVFSVAEQTDPKETGFAIDAMSMPLEALGYQTLEKFPVLGFFEKRSVLHDENILRQAKLLGIKIAEPK